MEPHSSNGHHRPVPVSPAAWVALAAGAAVAVGALLGTPGVTAAPPARTLLAGGALAVLAGVLALVLPASRALAVTAGAWLALIGWGAFSATGSLDRYLSEVALLGWTGGLGVLAALGLGTPVSRLWRVAAGLLVAAAVAYSAWALWHEAPELLRWFAGQGEMPRLKGGFTNADCLSAVLMAALLLACGLAAGTAAPAALGWMGASAVLLVALLLTGSRAGVAGAAVGLALYGGLLFARRDEEGQRGAVLGLAAPVLMAGLMLLGNFLFPVLDRWNLLWTEQGQQGIEVRVAVVREGALCVADRPLLGSGPGTFHLAFQEHRPPGLRNYVNVAHNDFMQVAVETGLVGLALWLAGLAVPMARASQTALRGPFPVEAAAAAGAAAAMAVYAALNFALPVPADLFWWCAVLGLCLSDALSKERPHSVPRLAMAPVALLLVLAGAAAGWLGLRMEQAGAMAGRAEALQRSLRWEEAAAAAEEAAAMEPGNPAHLVRLAGLRERQARYSGRTADLEQARLLLEAAHALSPADVMLSLELARMQRDTGQGARSEELLLATAREAPHDLRIQASLAQVYLLRGRLPEAAEALWQASIVNRSAANPLAALVGTLEESTPGSGTSLVTGWAGDAERREDALAVAREAAARLARHGFLDAADRMLTVDARNVCTLAERARVAVERKKPEQAMELLEQALTVEGAEGEQAADCRREALKRWTAMMIEAGRLPPAEERLREQMEAQPADSTARVLLCDVLVARGDMEGAKKLLRDGLARRSTDSVLLARMGGLYESEGVRETAIRYYQDALRHDPDNPVVAQKLQRLQAEERLSP